MKAKLLREVRKRYSIYRYANGFDDGPFVNSNKYSLVLKDDGKTVFWYEASNSETAQKLMGYDPRQKLFWIDGRYKTEKKVIQMLKDEMLRKILIAYKNKGVRRVNKQKDKNKVYYNENINIK